MYIKLFFRFVFMQLVISNYVFCNDPLFCEKQTNCDLCIGAGCTWCKDLSFTKQRCNTFLDHQSKNCPEKHIVKANPAKTNITNDDVITSNMRIRPQAIDVQLAVGQDTRPIKLTYIDKTDKALDLYYIMDLSATMENDKITVSNQAHRLVPELQKITKDIKLGFGSFIDKPVLPFVSASQLRPHPDYDIPYGFKNWLKLTHKWESFRNMVSNAKISRNLDEPEGTLDALMQAITCSEEIGWRNHSRKLIVVATDGPFHIAGDGKLGGIIRPNDMKCHMKDGMYTHSTLLDYPSIDEINAVILQHKVYVIFAVSKGEQDADVFSVYNHLQKHVSQSTVAELTKDSSNVVDIIKKKYQEISGKVELLINEKPDYVEVKVMAKCPKSDKYVSQMHCTDVGVGSQVDFQISLNLKKCPGPEVKYKMKDAKDKVVISFFEATATEKLVINLSYACTCTSCNQERNTEPNDLTLYCTGAEFSEYISCGACKCKEGRSGNVCQCSDNNENEPVNSKTCVNPKESQNSFGRNITCSDRGDCKCGRCDCHQSYNGKFCEDSTKGCQNRNLQNRLCSDKGQCIKGKCNCFDGYDGEFCECDKSRKKLCMEPGSESSSICNNHGTCDCFQGQCICNPNYKGLYCEVCKSNCPKEQEKVGSRCLDEFLQKCVRCNMEYQQKPRKKGEQNSCHELCDWKKRKSTKTDVGFLEIVKISTLTSLTDMDGTECRLKLNSTPCYSIFKYTYQRPAPGEPDILKLYYTVDGITCATEPPFLWYIFGVILSVLLAGILALLIWKLATNCHDRNEYRKFEKETKFARFAGGENPLYSRPMAEFQNPAYHD